MAHTPGPWGFCNADHFETRGDISISVIRGGFADGMLIAIVKDKGMRGTQIANARLIAAAPDLLAALKTAIEYIRTDKVELLLKGKPMMLEVLAMGDAAISRVEGGKG